MTCRLRTSALTLLLFLVLTGAVAAQSIALPLTETGAVVSVQSSIGTTGGIGATLGAGYTISGVLDLGLHFGANVVPSEDSVTSDMGMYYGFAAVKQSHALPVSAQIYGSYTVRSESSDFLTRNRLQHEARGYTLGATLVHDLFARSQVAIRVAAVAEFTNYLATTTVAFDPTGFTGTTEVDYAEYPQVQRLAGFQYGAYFGLMTRTARGGAVLVGAAALLGADLSIELRPEVQLLIIR